MRELEIRKSWACGCGQTHGCDIEKVVIGAGAVKEVPALLGDIKRVLLVSDGNTRPLCGDQVISGLTAAGVTVDEAWFDQTEVVIPDEASTEFILSRLQPGTGALIGIGSGVINDMCKYASFLKGLPYMIIATAPSMDGYASKGAAMIAAGMKVTYDAHVVRWIVGDTDILKDAPIDMIRAGIGDILGKFSCLNDWKLAAAITGEHFCPAIHDATMAEAKGVQACIDGCMARDPEAVGALMRSLVAVGVEMAYLGNSRPASGAEHHFSHFYEITGIVNGRPYFPHGIDVGYSAVVAQDLRRRIAAEDPAAFESSFDPAAFDARAERVYGKLAPEIKKLQAEAGFYTRDDLPVIREKWDEIRAILLSGPSREEMLDMVKRAGFHMDELTAFYGRDTITDCIESAKDLKNRYTLLWLLNSAGLLHAYAQDEFDRISTWG